MQIANVTFSTPLFIRLIQCPTSAGPDDNILHNNIEVKTWKEPYCLGNNSGRGREGLLWSIMMIGALGLHLREDCRLIKNPFPYTG